MGELCEELFLVRLPVDTNATSEINKKIPTGAATKVIKISEAVIASPGT